MRNLIIKAKPCINRFLLVEYYFQTKEFRSLVRNDGAIITIVPSCKSEEERSEITFAKHIEHNALQINPLFFLI